jgi:hypothetical protein
MSEHPDLEQLADFAAGTLARAAAEEVARHLDACPVCRLEVVRLRRFQAVGSDFELAAAARWDDADARLERAFPRTLPPRRRVRTWFLPAAAAAILAVALLGPLADRDRAAGPPRGEPATARVIVATRPLGDLAQPPRAFAWHATQGFDTYALEVLTPDLETICRLADIADTTVAMPDTLLRRIEPGKTYLWTVRGYRGLNVAATSAHAWFKVATGPAPASSP